jgi:hypothetical protein
MGIMVNLSVPWIVLLLIPSPVPVSFVLGTGCATPKDAFTFNGNTLLTVRTGTSTWLVVLSGFAAESEA